MKRIICFLLLLLSYNLFAQEGENTFKRHRLTLMMANSHVSKVINEQSSFFIIPTWGFDYDYFLTKRFALGMKNDIKLSEFEIEPESDEIIQRTYPVCTSVMATGKVWKELSVFGGPGYEFSHKSKSFFQLIVGAEYGFELKEDLELSLNFSYENKLNYYSAWMFGFGMSKYLGIKQ
ncbi:MAG: hypothetical protein ACTHJT_00890 [Cytophaga sp.]|uniref:hypothetical protein n=1 Tax=Cytophaga sp. TaxID=29535 RepID=UPI003F7EF509